MLTCLLPVGQCEWHGTVRNPSRTKPLTSTPVDLQLLPKRSLLCLSTPNGPKRPSRELASPSLGLLGLILISVSAHLQLEGSDSGPPSLPATWLGWKGTRPRRAFVSVKG